MDNRSRSLRFVAAILMAALLAVMCAVASADADPIRVSSLSEPQSVIYEQDVAITIKVYNSSPNDMQEEITLYNPDGVSVEKYAGLKGEQSVTYTGTWHVSKEQIKEGKIKYYIQYSVDAGNGPTKTTRTVPVTIQSEEAAPQLTATYSVSPASAREGQKVTLTYTLSNTGNVELRNIVVKNEGVSKEQVTAPALSVGEKVTLTDSFTMGKKELVSKPSVTYQAEGSKKNLTISDMARKTITVAEDGLEVELKASKTKDIYPGEKIELTLELKNTGNAAYTGLTALLSDGTEAASGIELAPGASFDKKISWSTTADTALSVSVIGSADNGEAVSVVSNEIPVATQDTARALVLDVKAQAQTDTIYSEPAVVRFGIVVKNVGETDATTLTVKQAGTTVATIPSLPSGESRTVVVDLQTSIAGKFQFVVSGKDADGNERAYESNIMQVVYVAPTPTPTAVPTPTPVPPTPSPAPTATPAPTLGEIIAEHVDLKVLYGVAGGIAAVLLAVLGVSGVTSFKRRKRMAQAIDTIEVSSDVRNHRGTARRRRNGEAQPDKKKKSRKIPAQAEPIVPAQELTEESLSEPEEPPVDPNSMTPARDAMRRAEREENRRRRAAVQEVPTDETLRVAPVDQRPEFIPQGKVDDSQTRIFGKLAEALSAAQLEAEAKAEPETEEAPTEVQANPEEAFEQDIPGQTIRLDRTQIDEINQGAQRKDTFRKGKKRDEIKPMKKKGFSLFGGRKKREEEEDDFIEELDEDFGDDDLFE